MKPKRVAMIILTTVAVLFLVVAGAAFFLQRAMIFPAPANVREPKNGLVRGKGFAALHRPGTPTVVHLHGNAEQLADSEWLADKFGEHGIGFYAVEYPGYGLSASTPVSEEAIYATVEAALVSLEETVPREQIILQGQSLGSGVAVEMAKRGHGSKLMLVSPYTSIPDVAAAVFPLLPKFLVRDRFDSASKAPDIKLPVLLVHGSEDEIVPSQMSRTLATLFPSVTLRMIDGARHNDLIDRPEVLEALMTFAR